MTGSERILTLLRGGVPDRLGFMPITMMFAAARAGLPYGRYALDHRVLVESQLRTAEEFGFDHVSAITETREAPDCGAPLTFFDDQPYALDEQNSLLADKAAFAHLSPPDPFTARHMSDRLLAITQLRLRTAGQLIVEGWVEGPCGAAADLRGINRLMLDFHDDPAFVRDLLEFVLQLAISFGRAQIDAGAHLIGIGDPAASLTGPRLYRDFVLPYQQRLVDALHAAGAAVRLHICGNTRRILPSLATLGCGIVDVDSLVPIDEARSAFGRETLLLGGLDPVRVLQNGSPLDVARAAEACCRLAGPRYILGAGCEVPPHTPPENLHALAAVALSSR